MNALKFKQKKDCFGQFYFETLKFPAKSFLGKLLQPLFVLHNDHAEIELGFSLNKALLENSM